MTILQRASAFCRDGCGATAVEFALIIGPLLFLLVGTIEVGRLMWTSHALDEVAIDAARCMGIHAPACADGGHLIIAHIVEAARSWGVVVQPADISLDTTTGCAVDTGFLRVGLSVRFESLLGSLGHTQLVTEACFPDQL